MRSRPKRRKVIGELGAARSLMDGPEQFDLLAGKEGAGGRPLVLGLGPDPAHAAARVGDRALFVECPAFAAQMDAADSGGSDGGWRASIPKGFEEVDAEAVDQGLLGSRPVYLYRHGPSLFPGFWGGVLARLVLAVNRPGPVSRGVSVLMPEAGNGLLVRELAQGFRAHGATVRTMAEDTSGNMAGAVAGELARERPSLYLSINFHGLDPQGQVFHLLDQAGVAVAAWCVDNPWHLLSGLASPFWRQLTLFVTDPSFIPGLKAHGAGVVRRLPLAAWAEMAELACGAPEAKGLEDRVVFVGRSRFPGKDAFFASARVDDSAMAEAEAMLRRGERPDFHWWRERMGVEECWPGKAVRGPGLGAEESGLALRTMCLAAAEPLGLTVFGDEGWRERLGEGVDLRPPVDYYGPLADVYARARMHLNMTSPLLPSGLTQRHFDVWACGGFLLTDATPGMGLFPDALAGHVCFAGPDDIPVQYERIMGDASLYDDLKRAWRDLIRKEHLYAHRAAEILDLLVRGQG